MECWPVRRGMFLDMEHGGTVALANSTDSCRQTICRPDARVRARNPALAGGFPMRGAKQFTGTRSRNVMGTGFLSELYTHVGQWGTHVDPPAHFIKGLRTVSNTCSKCSFAELTESRGTNEGRRRVHAHYRYHAGGFSHVFVRVFSAENCTGGRDALSNDSRPRILYAA